MARWSTAASIVLVFIGIGAIPTARAYAQTETRLGYVNGELILQRTPGYAEADSILRAEAQVYRQEIEVLQQQIDSAMTAFDQQSIMLSPAARDEKSSELRALQDRFNARVQELQNRSTERQRELVAPLEERIKTVIDGIRAERNLAFVFDAAAPGGSIISADRSLDLTSLVISRLQSGGGQ